MLSLIKNSSLGRLLKSTEDSFRMIQKGHLYYYLCSTSLYLVLKTWSITLFKIVYTKDLFKGMQYGLGHLR
jgi:hypothetical protein